MHVHLQLRICKVQLPTTLEITDLDPWPALLHTHALPETFTGYASCPLIGREFTLNGDWPVSLLIALYLLLVIVMPLALGVAVSYRTLPEGRTCTLCGDETLRIRARGLDLISLLIPRRRLQRRWCLACGWEGIARVPAQRVERPGTPRPVRRTRQRPSIAIAPGRSGEAVNLRKLDVDGSPWRVLLQCWDDTTRWHGRLLFIAPSGRLWVDTVEPFHGDSQEDVLFQALALPEDTLACRLRELISD